MSIKIWWKELRTIFDLTAYVNLNSFCLGIEILDFKTGFIFHLPNFVLYSNFLSKSYLFWMSMKSYGKGPKVNVVSQDLNFYMDLITGINIEIRKTDFPVHFDANLLGLRYTLDIDKKDNYLA